MKITARRLESQGKERFAQLFERIHPDGAASGLRPWEQRAVVEMRLNVFETRGNEVLTCCEDCGKHFLISPTSIVTALVKRQTIDCSSCGPCGSLLPVWKRKKP